MIRHISGCRDLIRPSVRPHGQDIFPVVGHENRLLGVVSRNYLLKRFEEAQLSPLTERLRDVITGDITVAFTDEPLRVVVYRMVESGFTRLPVVDREDEKRLVGMVSLDDLLRARSRNLEEEHRRERVIRLRMPLSRRSGSGEISVPEDNSTR